MTELAVILVGVGWILIDAAVKSTVLLLFAFGLHRLMLGRRPIAADTLWSTTMLMLLVLPFCCLLLPQMALPMPVSEGSVPTTASYRPNGQTTQATSGPLPTHDEWALWSPESLAEHPGRPVQTVSPEATRPETLSYVALGYLALLFSIAYALGAVVAVLRLATAYRALLALRRHTLAVSEESWTGVLRDYRQRLGMRRPVMLRASSQVSVPITVGWLRPAIIVPLSHVRTADADTIRFILLHELTHVARTDYLVHVITKINQCIYWYNPLIWLASRRLGQVRESVCDGYCVSSAGDQDGYVRLLVEFAQQRIARECIGLGLAMAHVSRLEQRLARLQPIATFRSELAIRLAAFVMALVATAVLGMTALAQPLGATADSGTAKSSAPTVADIVEGLKRAEQSIETLIVKESIESEHNFTKPGEPLPATMLIQDQAVAMRRVGTVSWEIERDGRGRMEAEYDVASLRFDKSPIHRTEAYISSYNGTSGVFVRTTSNEDGVVRSRRRETTDRFMFIGSSPFDMVTFHLRTLISELISGKDGRILERQQWENRPVIVVEVAPVTVRDDYIYRQRFWIDPSRNHLVVRRQSFVQRGDGKPWVLHYQVDLQRNKEVLPGIWLPMVVDKWNYHVTPEGPGHLVSRDHIEVLQWSVNRPIDRSRFELEATGVDRIGAPIVVPGQTSDQTKSDALTPESETEPAPDGFRYMLVRTVDGGGHAVVGTRIYVNIWPERQYETSKQEYFTNERGQVAVLVPDPPRLFRIWTQRQGYVPLFAQWWPEHQQDGHLIPKEFTFTLPSGIEIGGVITNEQGEPIEGAIVEVMLANRVDEMHRRPVPSIWLAEVPGPGNNPCVTNAAGQWSLNNVPEGEEIYVRLKLSHPKYVSDPEWGALQDEQSISMTSLRNRTASMIMRRGAVLTGTVKTPDGLPIPDAVIVWGDDPYLQTGSQEVRSNAAGTFELAPLTHGPVRLTVIASGWKPEARYVDIGSSLGSANFLLTKGNILRVRFVDSEGRAIPDVAVRIRGWRGAKSLYNHKHPNVLDTGIPTRASGEGIYEWTWAPDDSVDFSFFADGFGAVDRTLVADGAEHIVTFEK